VSLEEITQIYSFFLTTPLIVRLVVFNFIFKAHKHTMVILLDAIVLVSTTIWLILIREVIFPLPSLILNVFSVLYILLIIDISLNYYRLKRKSSLKWKAQFIHINKLQIKEKKHLFSRCFALTIGAILLVFSQIQVYVHQLLLFLVPQ